MAYTAEAREEELDIDAIVFADGVADKDGAGGTLASPDWLTNLQRNWGGKAGLPVADAKVDDISELLGGGLFQPLYKWMLESGPVYLLPTGPVTSYIVISDPECVKHVLRAYGSKYIKGTISEAGKFLFGVGVALAEGEPWKVRRKAIGPALHRAYVETMVDRVFGPAALKMVAQLDDVAESAKPVVDLETKYSQVTLDIIGKAVFNYDFDALNKDSPIIQAVYTSLKEVETRATDLLPFWKLPETLNYAISPRQRSAQDAVTTIREVTDELIEKCKAIVAEEEAVGGAEAWAEQYLNDSDPSVLRYFLAAREEVTSEQLRDDLLSLLVAGHETTASVLTWATYCLAQNPEALETLREEVNRVVGEKDAPSYADLREMPYLNRVLCETMRLYPQPPVYTRRAVVDDVLPTGDEVPAGQDILISIYNLHRSPTNWGPTSNDFDPMRFGPLTDPPPNETSTDWRYVPFSGGPRKCPGDQFAMMEAMVVLAVLVRRVDFELVGGEVKMTSGATIHTKDGLIARVARRRDARAGPNVA